MVRSGYWGTRRGLLYEGSVPLQVQLRSEWVNGCAWPHTLADLRLRWRLRRGNKAACGCELITDNRADRHDAHQKRQ